jgi:hypothetical protein
MIGASGHASAWPTSRPPTPTWAIDVGPVATGRRWRCGEGAIRPGDEVVAFGRTVERPGDWGEIDVAVTGGEEAIFIASELDKAEIMGTVTKITIAIYAFGTAWT